MNPTTLKTHLDKATYDKTYQDIEVLNYIGYSRSSDTWNSLHDIIDWTGKEICDLGGFHGYFSFKALGSGASHSTILDRMDEVLETTDIIIQVGKYNASTKKWTGGEPTPKCDVALCLNMLHHCADADETLKNINSDILIFEGNIDQVNIIKKYYNIVEERKSHRPNRTILLCERNNEV